MGAHPFDHHVKTKASLEEVYRELRDEEGRASGFGGYSGTITTTHGVQQVVKVPVTLAQAERIYDERIEKCEKWGYAEAIPTYEPLAKNTRTVTRKVKITAEQLAFDPNYIGHSVRQAAMDFGAALVREGETLDSAEVVNKEGTIWQQWDVTYTSKIVNVATEGAKQTRYFVQNQYGRNNEWANGHLTLAAAKAAVIALLKENRDGASTLVTNYNIVAETRRENGQPLTVIQKVVTGATATVKFTFTKRPLNPERTGWFIYGLAAS